MPWRYFEHLRAADDVAERRRIGPGHPDLGTEAAQCVVERGAPCRIEMGDDLIEQQHRRKPGHVLDQAGMGEHETDQQRLLLAGRSIRCCDLLAGVAYLEIRQMRSIERAPGSGVARDCP